MKAQFHVVKYTSCITKNQALIFTMILATLQQIVYSLQEKPQGGGGWGVNLNVSSNYHASRRFFLEWLSLAFTKSVKNELVNAKKPCWKETSARRI